MMLESVKMYLNLQSRNPHDYRTENRSLKGICIWQGRINFLVERKQRNLLGTIHLVTEEIRIEKDQ